MTFYTEISKETSMNCMGLAMWQERMSQDKINYVYIPEKYAKNKHVKSHTKYNSKTITPPE